MRAAGGRVFGGTEWTLTGMELIGSAVARWACCSPWLSTFWVETGNLVRRDRKEKQISSFHYLSKPSQEEAGNRKEIFLSAKGICKQGGENFYTEEEKRREGNMLLVQYEGEEEQREVVREMNDKDEEEKEREKEKEVFQTR